MYVCTYVCVGGGGELEEGKGMGVNNAITFQ